jgi:hypothetical protein
VVVLLVVLLHVLLLVGDRVLLPVLVDRGLKLVPRILMHVALQLQLLVLVGGRVLMLRVLVGLGLLAVVVMLVVILMYVLVLDGGNMLTLVGRGLQMLFYWFWCSCF